MSDEETYVRIAPDVLEKFQELRYFEIIEKSDKRSDQDKATLFDVVDSVLRGVVGLPIPENPNSVDRLDLSTRAWNALRVSKIHYLHQIAPYVHCPEELRKFVKSRNPRGVSAGVKSAKEICDAYRNYLNEQRRLDA